MPVSGVGCCVRFCFWPLVPLERCEMGLHFTETGKMFYTLVLLLLARSAFLPSTMSPLRLQKLYFNLKISIFSEWAKKELEEQKKRDEEKRKKAESERLKKQQEHQLKLKQV